MRKTVFALFTALLIFSCTQEPSGGDKPQGSKDKLTLSSASAATVEAAGGSVTVSFTASGDWTVSPSNDRATWIGISPASGTAGKATVTVTVEPNDTPDERSATLRVKCGSATASVTITQKQKDALTHTPSKTQFGAEGGNFTIEVTANVEYGFDIDVDWIHQSSTKALTTKTTTFIVDENDDTRKREGSVTVKSSLGSEKITVYQEAGSPTIILSSETVSVGAEGGRFTVDVNTNVDVTMAISAGAEWLSEVSTKAMSTHSYTFEAADNDSTDPRIGKITFKNAANGVEASVTVTQMPKGALVISQALHEIGADGGTISIEASTNVELDVAISQPWVRQVTTKGMNTVSYDFTVEANPDTEVRECAITFTGGGTTMSQPEFTQTGSWSLIGTIGGDTWTQDIEMKTDGRLHAVFGVSITDSDEFKFRRDKAWGVNFGATTYYVTTIAAQSRVPLAQDGGNMKIAAGTYDIYLNPDASVAYFIPAGTAFTFEGYGEVSSDLSQTVIIRQDGVDGFEAGFKDEYKLSARAQTLDLRSRSSVDIEAVSGCDWISVVETKAMSAKVVTLQIAENTSESARTGEVVVSAPALGLSQTVTISQAGVGEVYIPDAAFRTWLLGQFDKNGDGALSEAECASVTDIDLSLTDNPDIESVQGLEYFPKLSRLSLHDDTGEGTSAISELDLSGNTQLQSLNIARLHNIEGIYFNCPKLDDLSIVYCENFPAVDFSQFENLWYLSLSGFGEELTELDLSSNKKLYTLNIYDCSSLTKVIISSLKLTNLSITLCRALPYSGIILPTEDFALRYLTIDTIGPDTEEIDLSMCPELQSLTLSSRSEYWKITTIWLREGCSLTNIGGNARDAELRYKGDNPFVPVEFASTVFRDILLSAYSYNDANGDGEFSAYELKSIETVWLFKDYNQFDGTITTLEDLAFLPNLREFALSGYEDQVSAPIPEALKSLNKLETLYLDYCHLQGTLPEWIADLPALTNLSLYHCSTLGGVIPEGLIVGRKFEYINLDGCDFDDVYISLPSENLIAREGVNLYFAGNNRKEKTLPDGTVYNDISLLHFRSSTDGTGPVHADGEVVLYHAATKGPGFDIFITGDGFTEANNTVGGTLETYMKAAAEDILAQDPYCKIADYFNIWFIYAYSVREGTGRYDTAGLKFASWLNTPQGSYGTLSGGNFNYIVDYVQNVTSRHEASGNIAVIMNTCEHGGTDYWSVYDLYDTGLNVGYVTAGPYFDLVFVHEILGHGFAFLGDEYEEGAREYNSGSWTRFGFYSNLDYLSDGDASKARWAPFIADSRYAGEKLGAFLSAPDESSRIYSSTENSMMRHNFPGFDNYNRFNAPSREAIWQRFQVLLHPEQNWSSWEDYVTNGYNREEFVTFDLSPAPASSKAKRIPHPKRAMPKKVLPDGRVVERELPPLHPPVILTREQQ